MRIYAPKAGSRRITREFRPAIYLFQHAEGFLEPVYTFGGASSLLGLSCRFSCPLTRFPAEVDIG